MNFLSSKAIHSLVSYEEIIKLTKNGLIDYGNEIIEIPERVHLENSQNTFLLMPAFGENFYCTKLVNVCPKNKEKNKAVIQGLIVLFDKREGSALATLDAAAVTALRTGAVGAIGLSLICDSKIDALGIIGTGEQALYQVIFASEIIDFKKVNCFSRTHSRFLIWKERLAKLKPQLEIVWHSSAEEVVKNSEAIISACNSETPVFETGGMAIDEKKFVSIGSYTKDMQELPNGVYQKTNYVIVDSEQAEHEVGDIINAKEKGYIKPEDIILLSDILLGKVKIDSMKRYVFKSVGMAAMDYALSVALYKASKQNVKL